LTEEIGRSWLPPFRRLKNARHAQQIRHALPPMTMAGPGNATGVPGERRPDRPVEQWGAAGEQAD
jgi:hypothetical protein